MSDAQAWKVPASPSQRFQLHELAHGQANRIDNATTGRSYRRFMKAFGLDVIRDALRDQGGVPTQIAIRDRAPSAFTVTIENVEYGVRLAKLDRSTDQEYVLGDLFDLFERLKDGGDGPPVEAADFDAAADAARWKVE